MESSLAGKPERAGPVEVEDIRKDLLSDFSALPTLDAAQTENLQVFLRIRPFTSAESDSGEEQDCVTVEGPDTVILRAPRSVKSLPQTGQKFTFTQVFGQDSSQRAVFDGSVRTLVRDVLAGGNCLVFTYGVTNAGKTFTFLGPDHDSGLLPRSLSVIFNSIEGRLYQSADLKPLRCRDYTRLTPEQQTEDSATKRTLLKLFKESDRSHTSMKSTFLDGSNITDSSLSSDQDSFVVDDGGSAKFSIWVSFCEIYNDNIHDLLQHVPHGQQKRTVLRLSQDVKGNSFIKDLRWVQVSSSDEAYRIMKIGKKNQSMSSTRLNQLSSRSHSIFSVRLMKIDHVGGAARVLGISELSLCDLAGSERCSRTHNTGERLKEAGNINNSLLTLGKCISAMRNNQHNKFQQHIPFRESKLTHFLQFFFCGSSSGRVTMVVNINQSASCFDETLNVLKFSALAQKVVVLNSRPPPLAAALPRSAMEVSLIIDEAETRRFRGRKSSLVAWETSLEDVQEADDWEAEETEEMEETEGGDLEDSLDEEETELEETVLEAAAEDTMDQRHQSHTEAALRLVLEAQIREEVSAEFMELFNKMEKDYSERLDKEREILEERAEKRVEILKNLVHRTIDLSALESHRQDSEGMVLEDFLSAQELQKIREQQLNATELEKQRKESEQQLQELQQSLQRRQDQISELGDLCKQKEEVISKLTSALDQTVEDATRERSVVEAVRAELLQLQQNCSCLRERGSCGVRGKEERKRGRDSSDEESAPAKKRVLLEEEIWRLQEENDQKEQQITELRLQHREESDQKEQQITELRLQHQEESDQKEQQITELRSQHQEESDQKEQQITELRLQHQEESDQKEQQITELRSQHQEESRQQEQRLAELREEWEKLLRDLREERDQAKQKIKELREEKEQELEHLREENQQLEQLRLQLLEMETQMQKLSEEACPHCDSVFQSLESEQRETSRLNKENKALVNGIFTLQTEVTTLKQTLCSETDRSSSLSDELNSTRTRLLSLQSQSDDRDLTLQELRGEVDKLRLQGAQQDAFHTAMDRLKEESESALRESVKKERRLQDLQEQLQQSERLCADLREQSSNQTAACERVEAELKEQRDSLKQRLETIENQRLQAERENKELLQLLSLREDTVTEAHAQMETLKTELERLREQLQEPEENQPQEEEQENQPLEEEQENQPQEEVQEDQPQEEEQENQPQEEEQRPVTVVEQLREEMRKHRLRRNNRKQETGDENSPEEQENLREKEVREQRRMEAVQREVQRFRELQNHSELQRAAVGGASPERGSERSRRTPRTTSRKRKSCELQGLVFSENKRNRGRAGLLKQSSSSSVKDTTLTKLGEFITKSPSIISSTAKGLMELVVDGRSTGSKLKRGRRKLYKGHGSSPMLDSPNTGGPALEERESDHLTIKRQLRSKTRK